MKKSHIAFAAIGIVAITIASIPGAEQYNLSNRAFCRSEASVERIEAVASDLVACKKAGAERGLGPCNAFEASMRSMNIDPVFDQAAIDAKPLIQSCLRTPWKSAETEKRYDDAMRSLRLNMGI